MEDHVHHGPSRRALLSVNKSEACCGAHSLAEFYANATRYPGKNRLNTEQVLLFIDDCRERLDIVSLTSDEYSSAVKAAAAAGVLGGAIYDALLGACALKSGAEIIYTWNVRHFQQLTPEITKRLRTP